MSGAAAGEDRLIKRKEAAQLLLGGINFASDWIDETRIVSHCYNWVLLQMALDGGRNLATFGSTPHLASSKMVPFLRLPFFWHPQRVKKARRRCYTLLCVAIINNTNQFWFGRCQRFFGWCCSFLNSASISFFCAALLILSQIDWPSRFHFLYFSSIAYLVALRILVLCPLTMQWACLLRRPNWLLSTSDHHQSRNALCLIAKVLNISS